MSFTTIYKQFQQRLIDSHLTKDCGIEIKIFFIINCKPHLFQILPFLKFIYTTFYSCWYFIIALVEEQSLCSGI